MSKKSKKIPIDFYTEKLQEEYQKDLLEKVLEVIEKKGFFFTDEDDFKHFFTNRMSRKITDGITTWLVDGIELCASGPLVVKTKAKLIAQGQEIDTEFSFVEL